jgi:Phosphotransferase enzyme family
MPKYATAAIIRTNLLEHSAVRAWAKLRPERVEPAGIERLQKKRKGIVYRLEGVGPGGSDVIAKRSSPERLLKERIIYEQILPALPISIVRYYGFIEEPDDGCCWLFLESAGGEEYSSLAEKHRALAGRWLGLLHTSAARVAAAARLPDRGPGYYLAQLRQGCDTILRNLSNPALTADDVKVLETVLRQCEVVRSHWSQVEKLCEGMPRTLIHGDFAPKNMRVRTGQAGGVLLPFDWGSAGWGVAAADLASSGTASNDYWDYWANPDLAAYRSVVWESWPRLETQDAESLAVIGKIFRCLVCINLEAPSFAMEWVENAVRDMRIYQAAMADAIQEAGWER